MRIWTFFWTFALLTSGAVPRLQAAPLFNDHKVTFAGTITQPSTVKPGETVTMPLNAKNLLKILGMTDVPPANTEFAFDTTTASYMLTSKDRQTVYATILTFDPNNFVSFHVSGPPYNPGYTSYRGGGAITMLNNSLLGTAYYGVFSKGKTASEPATILAYGVLGATVTLIKDSVLESGPNPP